MPSDPAVARWQTARLAARPAGPEDIDFAAALFALPEITAHRPDPAPDDRATTAARLARDAAHWAEHGFGRWLLSDAGGPAGFGGLTCSAGETALNLSYHLHPARWGLGYATEFGRAALALAFGPLQADAVVGLARPANPASQAVLRRLGFTLAGEIPLHGAPTLRFVHRGPG